MKSPGQRRPGLSYTLSGARNNPVCHPRRAYSGPNAQPESMKTSQGCGADWGLLVRARPAAGQPHSRNAQLESNAAASALGLLVLNTVLTETAVTAVGGLAVGFRGGDLLWRRMIWSMIGRLRSRVPQ
jgi:hypothetical protein